MDNVALHRAYPLVIFITVHIHATWVYSAIQPPSRDGVYTSPTTSHLFHKQPLTLFSADDPTTRAVINHNPLPELTHEDFVSLLGPILVPEHYNGLQSHHWHSHPSLPHFPPTHAVYGPGPGLPPPIPPLPEHQQIQNQLPSPPLMSPPPPLPPNTPGLPHNPPFTFLHFTGRHKDADKVTLSNVTGVDSLARDRFWRDKSTFALDCTAPVGDSESRRAREAVFKHVDVIFFS